MIAKTHKEERILGKAVIKQDRNLLKARFDRTMKEILKLLEDPTTPVE